MAISEAMAVVMVLAMAQVLGSVFVDNWFFFIVTLAFSVESVTLAAMRATIFLITHHSSLIIFIESLYELLCASASNQLEIRFNRCFSFYATINFFGGFFGSYT